MGIDWGCTTHSVRVDPCAAAGAVVGTVHMEDATPADIVNAGGTAAGPVKSLLQTDAIGLKTTLWASSSGNSPRSATTSACLMILERCVRSRPSTTSIGTDRPA